MMDLDLDLDVEADKSVLKWSEDRSGRCVALAGGGWCARR